VQRCANDRTVFSDIDQDNIGDSKGTGGQQEVNESGQTTILDIGQHYPSSNAHDNPLLLLLVSVMLVSYLLHPRIRAHLH